jgi:hypothetical protein
MGLRQSNSKKLPQKMIFLKLLDYSFDFFRVNSNRRKAYKAATREQLKRAAISR